MFLLDRIFFQSFFLNEYPKNNGRHLLLNNHSTSFDGYLAHIINNNYVSIAKDVLIYIPFLGQSFWLLDYIFVKRSDKNSRNNTKNKMIQKINENYIIQLFPQGTRERNKFFKKNEIVLKKGSIEIAVENNIPILLLYHSVENVIDDVNMLFYFDKKVYADISNFITLPNEYNELPLQEKVDILYKIVYDEFIRLEKNVLDRIELDNKLDNKLDNEMIKKLN